MLISPTSKIQLHLPEERQASELYALIDKNRAYLRQWLPWLDTQRSPGDTLQFIRTVREQIQQNETLTLAIWFEKNLCGVISYHRFDWTNRASMVGYWLTEELQGKGIMTEACRAMVDHGFSRLGLHRIEIRCAPGNRKSWMIPERLGFKKEAVLRDAEWLYDHYVDLIVYSMLAPDWKKSHH
ncbi:MAG: GNAT family N-acetyltransferase [Ignavibacteriales bacterium]|nr:GNAT family N-acetyltransferase [Ignavibacteriales bacterium]